jgi:ribosomal protein S4
VRPRQTVWGDDTNLLNRFAKREAHAEKERRRLEEEEAKGMAPVGSLMFMEVERRIDIFIFRCCFAHSVYEARRLVVHGYVLLNGKKHQNANTRLAPGDMVSVDPEAIRFLQPEKDQPPKSENTDDTSVPPTTENPSSSTSSSGLKNVLSKPDSAGKPLTPFNLPDYASPFLFIPAYIEVSFQTCSAIYVRHPTARPGYSEIPTPFDADGEIVRLAWEWYAKVRPRMRSKSQLARMPENRKSPEEMQVGR